MSLGTREWLFELGFKVFKYLKIRSAYSEKVDRVRMS
jgi:hypothetical protein